LLLASSMLIEVGFTKTTTADQYVLLYESNSITS
jgi:hypothetical protein